MTITAGVRCLTCLREHYHAAWCPDGPPRPDDTLVGGPEMAVEPRNRPGGTPRWAVGCVVAGAALMALAAVGWWYRGPVAMWLLMWLHS